MSAQVALDSLAVDGIQLALQRVHLADDEVQDACAGPPPGLARRGGAARAEELVEGDARVPHHGEGLVRGRPRDGVRVDARVAVRATSGLIHILNAELHGRDRRVLAEALGVELVERGADPDIRTLGLLGVRLGEEGRAGAEVVAADLLGLPRLGALHVGVADDRQVVAVRFQRTQDAGSEIEATAGFGG